MNPRLTAPAAFCREVALPALVFACIAAPGVAGIDTTRTAPIVDRLAQSIPANAAFADKLPAAAIHTANVATRDVATHDVATTRTTDVATPDKPTTQTAAISEPVSLPPVQDLDVTTAAVTMAAVTTTALTASPEALPPPEAAPKPDVTTTIASLEPDDLSRYAAPGETPDGCSNEATCVDHYLWSLYQQTPKEDAIKVEEKKQVTVKKKGKMVTVTRTFARSADEDFGWKDPKAAERVGLPMQDYVIGGMDHDFKARLFQMLRAAEAAGLGPGITSAFRDDYRQSIASGLKAADNRSYHGGSLRGGYGHGLAADIVSINGATRTERLASSEALWKWVDTHGKDFGIGRPYLSRDPPHVAPIDGQEYATHHPGGMRARQAGTAAKPGKKIALGNPAKHARAAKSDRG
jgi:hypothetical protein